MSKSYTSFKEIDLELKRLKLQSEISKEELKLNFHSTKKSASPSNLIGGMFGGLVSSGFIFKLLMPVATFAIGKLTEKKEK
ncbi:hypothetical protein ULMS_03890 [Patiriisocius marinistellae]|uniref:Uncharacterized protein n=1 Tax=Patiriisocius marinistellae TaxID=2494560 RepID=A0A5J4FYW9_9FLAO|nr:DUF6327 family protein [Patiriisocius marinistellae]GEQ84881.1 hypothetical protein ULMS_03890 [Patiriisocius marinistellae]